MIFSTVTIITGLVAWTCVLAIVADSFSPLIQNTGRKHAVAKLGSSSSPQDPCWQDLYDEDCAMETLFAANYVAGEWIKKLPCAQGMEDCDFPDEEFIPEIRPESNYEEIDVMGFLNIKRAVNVDEKNKD